ncbi:hypothetical protein QOT17_004821 [Balamuthia mandrillaris]
MWKRTCLSSLVSASGRPSHKFVRKNYGTLSLAPSSSSSCCFACTRNRLCLSCSPLPQRSAFSSTPKRSHRATKPYPQPTKNNSSPPKDKASIAAQWNAVLLQGCQSRNAEFEATAKSVMKAIQERTLHPTRETLTNLFVGLLKHEALDQLSHFVQEEGKILHSSASRRKLPRNLSSSSSASSCEALQDPQVLNAMVAACAEKEDAMERAFRLVDLMETHAGTEPDLLTFVNLVHLCGRRRQVSRAMEYIMNVREREKKVNGMKGREKWEKLDEEFLRNQNFQILLDAYRLKEEERELEEKEETGSGGGVAGGGKRVSEEMRRREEQELISIKGWTVPVLPVPTAVASSSMAMLERLTGAVTTTSTHPKQKSSYSFVGRYLIFPYPPTFVSFLSG